MNILFYLTENDQFMYSWQRIHIFHELESLGKHKIFTVNIHDYVLIEESQAEVISILKKCKIDIFITGVEATKINNEFFHILQTKGIPSLLICYDNLHAPYLHLNVCNKFDLVWLTSKQNEGLFKKTGANIIHLPYAANPLLFKPNFSNEKLRLCFVGSLYGTRLTRIADIVTDEIRLDTFSKDRPGRISTSKLRLGSLNRTRQLLSYPVGRKMLLSFLKSKFDKRLLNEANLANINFNHPLDHDAMIAAYSNYAMVLNITELRNTFMLKRPIHKLHLRTFEIPMCGGIQFAPYSEELSNYFEDRKEIIMFKSEDDMREKAEYYLRASNSNIRQEIRQNALERSRIDHTWTARFNEVFRELNIKTG